MPNLFLLLNIFILLREQTVFVQRGLFLYFPFLINSNYLEIFLFAWLSTTLLQKSVYVYNLCLASWSSRSLISHASLCLLFHLVLNILDRTISMHSRLFLFFIFLYYFWIVLSILPFLLFPFLLLSYGFYFIFSFFLLFLSLGPFALLLSLFLELLLS